MDCNNPLNTNNADYRAETVPLGIQMLGEMLRRKFGTSPLAFGAKGNECHLFGYHRSRNWILRSPDSEDGGNDYSIRRPLDQGGADTAVSAFDYTPGEWGTKENREMVRTFTARIRAAAQANDPRVSSLSEFAGNVKTNDGNFKVVTFDVPDIGHERHPFDNTHLDHIHGSFWRSRANADHSGIFQVLTGMKQEESMYLANVQGTDAVVLTNGVTGRWVSAIELPHLLALHQSGVQPLTSGNGVQKVPFLSMVGQIVGPRPPQFPAEEELVQLLAAIGAVKAQLSQLGRQMLVDAVIAAPNTRVTEGDRPRLIEATEGVPA